MRFREAEVVIAILRYVGHQGYASTTEFPLLGRVADVFAIRGRESSLAIECKERDWRRGLIQASRYRAAADQVFLAIPVGVVTEEVADAAVKLSIGLMAVDETGVTVVVGSTSAPMPALRMRAFDHFEARREL